MGSLLNRSFGSFTNNSDKPKILAFQSETFHIPNRYLQFTTKLTMDKLTINKSDFIEEEKERIAKYYSTNKQKLSGFINKSDFFNWYITKIQREDAKCHYCDTSILKIRELLNLKLINGRKVGPGGSGFRGPNLELDRKDPFGIYSQENCVLSCYYCNNDKSNTFDYETYKNIVGPSKKEVWGQLIKKCT